MFATFAAIALALASLSLTGPTPSVHRLEDGGVLAIAKDSSYTLCYGHRCQVGTVLEIVDSLAALDVTDCVDHSTTERTTCRGFDELADQVYFGHAPGGECAHGGASRACNSADVAGLIPGDYGCIRGRAYDTALFERAISDSARAADSARGEVPAERRRPCKVGGTWMLCPDRSSHLIAPPAAAPVQLARVEISEPARETTCYSEISCPR